MGNVALRVENLGKEYRIGTKQERYRTLRDTLTDTLTAPLRRVGNLLRGQAYGAAGLDERIWALRDVSFEINHGDVVGIIGRNGAGKSTLLKILSRITEPTTGRVELYGRVGALLEVGTGFHPELTGRENIYLNASILGMSRVEIERKFDEIVDFAEVEKFIDTPVKHYSSGMALRLGFAVAAHMEPEILVVDEVLAVGDAQFQKKCLGKMSDVAGEGRTVLFVSHNMAAVQNLCNRGIVLFDGQKAFDADIEQTIKNYIVTSRNQLIGSSLRDRKDRKGSGVIRLSNLTINTDSFQETNTVSTGDDLKIIIDYETYDNIKLKNVSLSIPFYNHYGQHMTMCWTRLLGADFESIPPSGQFVLNIPKFPLSEGRYHINLFCEVNGIIADWITEAVYIDVTGGDFYGTGRTLPFGREGVLIDHHWDVRSS